MPIVEFISLLRTLCEDSGVMLTQTQLQSFALYKEFLLKWNAKMNLTAITDPTEIAAKHFVDSLALLQAMGIKESAQFIDIGTGAGFPGVPLKIVRPDLDLTLLDSLNKRLHFLHELADLLHFSARFIHGRAEVIAHHPHHREQYDFVTARAVSSLPVLCELCLPFVRFGGTFAAMKGPAIRDELAAATKAVSQLGGEISDLYSYQLPEGSKRSIVLIKKIYPSPAKYPRHGSKISKSPL